MKLAIAVYDGIASFAYSWSCGDGCCSNTDYRDEEVVKGMIYELSDAHDVVYPPLLEIPDDYDYALPNFRVDEDGWLQKVCS